MDHTEQKSSVSEHAFLVRDDGDFGSV